MKWDNVLDRLEAAGLKPVEEFYMENYGKVLAVDRPEFKGRYFRCTFGEVRCAGLLIEAFIFPSELQREEFLEVIGDNPWYIPASNVVLHFPETDPGLIDNILWALSASPL